MSKLYRARSRRYRRQILQENIRWKALDEIYKIYMLLHRSDLNISEKIRQTFSQFFGRRRLKKRSEVFGKILQISSNFFAFFFRAQAVEEALRKDRDCPAEKETPKKEKGGGKRPRRFAAPST